MKKSELKLFIYLFLIAFIITMVLLASGNRSETGPFIIIIFVSLALFCMGHAFLKNFVFTVWVLAFVSTSMFYPAAFGTWFGFDLKVLIVPLIQIIMFGMGTTLSIHDFKRVITMPWPVFIGILLQFSVMPFAGYTISMLFGFEPEIAAGVILIGSCPGGVASNLMAYLAGANVALSVTMTSCSTLMSPVMTPFMMKILAGRLVPIDFVAMMLSIFNMIIVPIVAGLVANDILYNKKRWTDRAKPLWLMSAINLLLAILTLLVGKHFLGPLAALKNGIIIGFTLIGVVALVKLIINILLKGPEDWMDRALPIVSMSGICFIIAIITARSSDELLTVGLSLIAATITHNFIGYLLGYWIARAVKLDVKSSRTVAFEVGMQNGGMASGLAIGVLNSAKTALAPAIFGPFMNVSGSMLATWWHRKSVKQQNAKIDKKNKK